MADGVAAGCGEVSNAVGSLRGQALRRVAAGGGGQRPGLQRPVAGAAALFRGQRAVHGGVPEGARPAEATAVTRRWKEEEDEGEAVAVSQHHLLSIISVLLENAARCRRTE